MPTWLLSRSPFSTGHREKTRWKSLWVEIEEEIVYQLLSEENSLNLGKVVLIY